MKELFRKLVELAQQCGNSSTLQIKFMALLLLLVDFCLLLVDFCSFLFEAFAEALEKLILLYYPGSSATRATWSVEQLSRHLVIGFHRVERSKFFPEVASCRTANEKVNSITHVINVYNIFETVN